MCTLDASVFVRDLDVRDAEHASCHALLQHLADARIPIIVPTLLLAEIAGPISRERHDPIGARLAVEALRAQPHIRFIAIDDIVVQEAAELAADYALRGADATVAPSSRSIGSSVSDLRRLSQPEQWLKCS